MRIYSYAGEQFWYPARTTTGKKLFEQDASENSTLIPDYTAIDLEMSGINDDQDHILQIGAVRFRNWTPQQTFMSYIHYTQQLSPQIQHLLQLQPQQLLQAPTLAVVLPQFYQFIQQDVLVGHHIATDLFFILHAAQNYHLPPRHYYYLDTLYLAQRFLKTTTPLANFKLETLKNFFHLPFVSHDALADALSSGIILKLLQQNNLTKTLPAKHPVEAQIQVEKIPQVTIKT